MNKAKFVAIRNVVDSSTLELHFLDIIQDSFDWMTGMITSQVQEIIDKVNAAQPRVIKLIIDSEGGDAQAGLSIYNFLKRTDARVETEVIGLAGSIASVIAMAANPDKLKIARNGFMMIHKAEGMAFGTGEELRAAGDLVDKYTGQIVDIYAQRTGKTPEAIQAMIAPGDFWMTGQEAVDQGFADATFNDAPLALNIAARLNRDVYKNFPPAVRAELDAQPNPGEDNATLNFFTNQFETMKEKLLQILNAIRGVKPATDGAAITADQIADAMRPGFEALAADIDTEITNRVNALPKPAEVPTPEAITAQVTSAVTAAGIAGQVQAAVDAAIAAHKTEIEALKLEITNMKGKQLNKTHEQNGTGEFVPSGKFSKA